MIKRGDVVVVELNGNKKMAVVDWVPLESVPYMAEGKSQSTPILVEFYGGEFSSLHEEYFAKWAWKRVMERLISDSADLDDFLARVRKLDDLELKCGRSRICIRSQFLEVYRDGRLICRYPVRDLMRISVASNDTWRSIRIPHPIPKGTFHVRIGYLKGNKKCFDYVLPNQIIKRVKNEKAKKFRKRWDA